MVERRRPELWEDSDSDEERDEIFRSIREASEAIDGFTESFEKAVEEAAANYPNFTTVDAGVVNVDDEPRRKLKEKRCQKRRR